MWTSARPFQLLPFLFPFFYEPAKITQNGESKHLESSPIFLTTWHLFPLCQMGMRKSVLDNFVRIRWDIWYAIIVKCQSNCIKYDFFWKTYLLRAYFLKHNCYLHYKSFLGKMTPTGKNYFVPLFSYILKCWDLSAWDWRYMSDKLGLSHVHL